MALEQHKRCLDCSYILDALPENRCPECARGFDPANPRTFLEGTHSGRAYAFLAAVGAAAILIPLAGAELGGLDRVPARGPALLPAPVFLIIGLVVEVAVFIRCLSIRRLPHDALAHHKSWVAALAISVSIFVTFLIAFAVWYFG